MTRNQVEKFAAGYPYPTDWVEMVLRHFAFDTDKAKEALADRNRTYEIVQKQIQSSPVI